MSDMTLHEIGQAAGAVYRYLHEHGEISTSKLPKKVDLPAKRVDQALGWLAREGKVTFTTVKRTTTVALA